VASLPLVAVAVTLFRWQVRGAYRAVRYHLARLNASMSENIMGMRVVQLFRREKLQHEEYDGINRDYLAANLRQVHMFALFRPSTDLLGSLGLALLIWYGAGQVLHNLIEFGTLYAFITYLQQAFWPINDLAEKFDIMQSAMAASERVFWLLDTQPEVVDPPAPVPLVSAPTTPAAAAPARAGRLRGEVEFDHVWFAYNEGEWVLRDVTFHVAPGQTVAFVGHTGAGKSSIVNLIGRLYDIQQGAIRIDGIDIRQVRQADLRRRIGIVLQDVYLFTGDIRSNIKLSLDLPQEKVEEVARLIGADEFIARLPNGYAEPVSERGSTLSGGQRQLLAFARTLAFDPDILVLDEATANVDTHTEQVIQRAMKTLTAGRTTLIVAHRLSTVQDADCIYVVHKGRIRESGTHQELLAQRGLYYRLYTLQARTEKAAG